MDPVPKLIIPKLITGPPDVGAITPVRPYSPPVKLGSRRLSQTASRHDAADNMIDI